MPRLSLGAHIGQQNMTMDALRQLWRRLEDAGLDWISIWDHFYEAPPQGGTVPHYEALTTLGALAAETERVQVGCLVFYVGYRNPGLLAKAATTLDHLSGGRFVLGLGAGWHEWEARAYGYDFPDIGTRLDMLEEAVQIIRGLLTQERTTFSGRHFRVENASNLPAPVQERLPIWIGGLGEKRTLRLVARYADGWNAAYVSAEKFAHLGSVLDRWCEVEDRDPTEIERTVNLSFSLRTDAAGMAEEDKAIEAQWGPSTERIRSGSLLGRPDQAFNQVSAYVEAGAQAVNVALRAPWDDEALDAYLHETVPALRQRFPG